MNPIAEKLLAKANECTAQATALSGSADLEQIIKASYLMAQAHAYNEAARIVIEQQHAEPACE